MNVPHDELDRWRRAVDEARGLVNAAGFDLAAGRMEAARDRLQGADGVIRRLGLRLEEAGADRPAGNVRPPEVPLRLLDTPANRRYAETLREAWAAGMAVDRERYGDDIGTDGCAQVIEMVLADVERELHGPAGRLRE